MNLVRLLQLDFFIHIRFYKRASLIPVLKHQKHTTAHKRTHAHMRMHIMHMHMHMHVHMHADSI